MTARQAIPLAFRYSLAAGILALAGPLTAAADEAEFHITVRDGRFGPNEVAVPAGRNFVLIVDNVGDAIEEFESYDLNREKVIAPKSRATIPIGPLKAGRYEFFNEFSKQVPPGTIRAE